MYAIIEGGLVGFGAVGIVILLGLGLSCFAALVLYELRHREPLLEVRFLHERPVRRRQRDRRVSVGGARRVPIHEHGLPAERARALAAARRLYMLPTATMLIIFAPISGRLVGHLGARPSMVAGGLAVLACGLMLTCLAPGTSVPLLLSAYPASASHWSAHRSPTWRVRDAPGAGGRGLGGDHGQS
jgi:hypothetical protein